MMHIIPYIELIVGFVLLIKGADYFVDGSSAVAHKLKISSLIIGMTIVAMGTSLPECAVSVSAAISHQNGLAISNAVGSNIFNLMVVLGVCALFCPVKVEVSTLKKEFPFSVIVAALLMGFGFTGMLVGHIEGIILLLIFVLFILWMIWDAKKKPDEPEEEVIRFLPAWRIILYIVLGAAAICIGGKMVVWGATDIAQSFGMSDNLIGLTIVALGTSLPELVTSIAAARRNQLGMAVGNVIGSNIFNILMVLGVACAISPLNFTMENIVDIIVLIGMSVLVWLFCWPKKQLVRWQGILMLVAYAAYMVYACKR